MDANTINTTESLWDNYATLLAASSYDPQTKDLLSWLVATAKKENWNFEHFELIMNSIRILYGICV